MDTIMRIQKAIDYIEDNIFENLKFDVIASQAYMSNYHFQRIFSIICNITLGEYIRNRRLSLAGLEIKSTDKKIIDIAFKYGYETPESFSRAFTRFHSISPMAARIHGDINSFAKISIKSILEGKMNMENLKQRGYSVKENGPIYYTNNMDKTVKWFEDVLGWYGGIDARNDKGVGTYGCLMPVPGELVNLKISAFNGIHMFYGEPLERTVAFMCVDGLDNLYEFVKKNGWNKITDIKRQTWGAIECDVITIDGSIIRFFELDKDK